MWISNHTNVYVNGYQLYSYTIIHCTEWIIYYKCCVLFCCVITDFSHLSLSAFVSMTVHFGKLYTWILASQLNIHVIRGGFRMPKIQLHENCSLDSIIKPIRLMQLIQWLYLCICMQFHIEWQCHSQSKAGITLVYIINL